MKKLQKDLLGKRLLLPVVFALFLGLTSVPQEAMARFSESNTPNSTETWRSQPRVKPDQMKKVSGKTFASPQRLVNKSGILYENCVFEGPVRVSDCSSIHFKNCRFDLKGSINTSFVELYYTDDIVFNNNVFENAFYDNFRHYISIYNSPLIYEYETIRGKDPILSEITYSAKWVNAFFIHHGGDVTFSTTKLKNVWVVKENSLSSFTKSLPKSLRVGLRNVSWKSIAPYVFRFEGNTRLIQGDVIGADAFEGLSYSPFSSYKSLDKKIPDDLNKVWLEMANKIKRFRRGISLCDAICRDGFRDPAKPLTTSAMFKASDSVPGKVKRILLKARMSFVSEKYRQKAEIPVKRLAFTEDEIKTLRSYFHGSWYCAFRLLYLCEKFQRMRPGSSRDKVQDAIRLYSMALLHGMHPPRCITYTNSPRYAGWNHKLIYAERKKNKQNRKEELISVSTKGAAYQGKPLLSCSCVCLWALARARQCGVYFDQDLFALAMLSFRNSISQYSSSFPYLPKEKDDVIIRNMDRIYLMDSFCRPSRGISVSDWNKPFLDSEMLPRNGMIYLAMTSMGMKQFDQDIIKLKKLLRQTLACSSAGHGAPAYGLWIYAMSITRIGDDAVEAFWAQYATLLQHHLSKIWMQFMPVADQKAESDAPPIVYSSLKVPDVSKGKLYPIWEKRSESISSKEYFNQQKRLFFNAGDSKEQTYKSPMPGYAKTLAKKSDRFKRYCNHRCKGDYVKVDSNEAGYEFYIAVQSGKSLTNYSHSPTDFLSASVALRRSKPWVVCMPGVGGYGLPVMLKAEKALISMLFDEKLQNKISNLIKELEDEDVAGKKDAVYKELHKVLCAGAQKAQVGKEEINPLFLPELAWRIQATDKGQLLFLTVGSDSLLKAEINVKTDGGKTLIKAVPVLPGRPLFYEIPLSPDCNELIVDWSYSKVKLTDKLSIAKDQEGRLRQIR